jgi:hypothetical protein
LCCEGFLANPLPSHVKGAPSEGVAHRITAKVERRFQQYLEVAEDVAGRSKAS